MAWELNEGGGDIKVPTKKKKEKISTCRVGGGGRSSLPCHVNKNKISMHHATLIFKEKRRKIEFHLSKIIFKCCTRCCNRF